MANTLRHDCPYCGTQNVAFTHYGTSTGYRDDSFNMMFNCNHCQRAVVLYVETHDGQPPRDVSIDSRIYQHNFASMDIQPHIEPIEAPYHCPNNVSESFIKAEQTLRLNFFDTAAIMARKALELAIKDISPDSERVALFNRIEKLSSEGKITPALKEWAQQIRDVGNDAAHETDEVTKQEAEQTVSFVKYFLIYIYTLPKQVEIARSGVTK